MVETCRPFRRGRGGQSEETRQLESELIGHLNTLAKCLNTNVEDLAGQIADLDTSGGGEAETPDVILQIGGNPGSGLAYFFPNGTSSTSASITANGVQVVADRAYTLREVTLRVISGADAGNSEISVHLDGAGAAESNTQSLDAADGTVSFPFNTSIAAGQTWAVGIDPQFNPGILGGYVRLEPA